MAQLRIFGGRPLTGTVRIGGRKNSAVAVLPAALLAHTPSVLENLPEIGDVETYVDILTSMGVRVERHSPKSLLVDPRTLRAENIPQHVVKKIRASYYLLGVLLGRTGYAEVALPGGCDIGLRPIDLHIKGFRALGAEVEIVGGMVRAQAKQLRGAPVYLDVASVGATINIMLAAALAEGTTIIENAAKESHVVDLASYLNAMGARIIGAGTDVIKIHGVKDLEGATHGIIPDEIEAATYMIGAAGTRGDIVVENVVPKHLDSISAKLREAGVEILEDGDSIRVRGTGRPRAVNVKTLSYPGFPTDAQQPMTALLSIADGVSTVTESVWEARFKHVDELQRMGTRIKVNGRTATIEGVEKLSGASVQATDLRAGAALVVAGLIAEGETKVSGIELVERGYERLHEKLHALGAEIERVEDTVAAEVG